MRDLLAHGTRFSVRIKDLDVEEERLSLSLLHRSGARVQPDEAEGTRSFAEEQEQEKGALETRLGDLLDRALEEREDRSA